jgi:hypothetical protein
MGRSSLMGWNAETAAAVLAVGPLASREKVSGFFFFFFSFIYSLLYIYFPKPNQLK